MNKNLVTVIDNLNERFGKGTITQLGDKQSVEVSVISSGFAELDTALGIGGYPRGRIVEIYGPESSGKTTLALRAIAEVQASDGIAAFIDAEHAFDVSYARALGVDTEKLLVSQPDTREQALEIVEVLTRSEVVDIVVVSKTEIDDDMGEEHRLQARLMSQALRKLTAVAHRTGTTIVFINHLQEIIRFGRLELITGSNALKFYASVRLDVRRLGPLKVGDAVIRFRTRVRVVKNKLACPFQEAELEIRDE